MLCAVRTRFYCGWLGYGVSDWRGPGKHGGRDALMDVRQGPIERSGSCRRTEMLVKNRYWIACAIVKIGRYIAMTINPMMVPNITIMIGSRSDVRAATAWSTSSS